MPVGEGVWRVWRVLEGFGRFCRLIESHCCGLGPGVPVGELWPWPWGACWGRCLEGLEGFGGYGMFAGWQTAVLKANRKLLLWPWPWGACWGRPLLWPWPWGACWGRCLDGLEGFGGFGGFWRVLERLRPGKRQL